MNHCFIALTFCVIFLCINVHSGIIRQSGNIKRIDGAGEEPIQQNNRQNLPSWKSGLTSEQQQQCRKQCRDSCRNQNNKKKCMKPCLRNCSSPRLTTLTPTQP